jgi:uncharacterized protein (DUF58 family)
LADPTHAAAARRAEALAGRLPPLLVAAERVAATVAQGVHGRRRVGTGDSFWQFRPFITGDPVSRIDWRQSAKSGRPDPHGWFLRETEWEAAQTVCLWNDTSPSMRWCSPQAFTEKAERAELLLLALASLLLRAGEHVSLIGSPRRPFAGTTGLERLAETIAATPASDDGLPPNVAIPRHAQVVLFSDFLAPIDQIHATISRLAAIPATASLLQILDPAEVALPYSGRIRFRGLEREGETLIPRVENVREAYAARLTAQQDAIRGLCIAAGFGFSIHHTDHPAEAALLSLYTSLSAR